MKILTESGMCNLFHLGNEGQGGFLVQNIKRLINLIPFLQMLYFGTGIWHSGIYHILPEQYWSVLLYKLILYVCIYWQWKDWFTLCCKEPCTSLVRAGMAHRSWSHISVAWDSLMYTTSTGHESYPQSLSLILRAKQRRTGYQFLSLVWLGSNSQPSNLKTDTRQQGH
jgi:hypothetical protein